MDVIYRTLTLDDNVAVTGIDLEEALSEAVKHFSLSDTAATACGRLLLSMAFLSSSIKGVGERYTAVIDGKGGLGQLVGRADSDGSIRCSVENPAFECEMYAHSRQSIKQAVGVDGTLTVIHDLGLKEPYIGKTALVNGEISDDFAYYFTFSQQTPSAVAMGVKVQNGKVLRCVGIFAQLLPQCPDHIITMLEDIVSMYTHLDTADKNAKQIILDSFDHLGIKWLDEQHPVYRCDCTKQKIDALVKSVGYDEAISILDAEGKISVVCEFCNRRYDYDRKAIDKLFSKNKA